MGKKKKKESRRSFLNIFLGGTLIPLAVSVFYPVIRYLIPPRGAGEATPQSVESGTVGDLAPNSGKIIRYGNKPVILLRTPEGDIRAFSAICTHLGCTVQYRKDLQHIWCACHNGHYDLNGKNIAGPPPRPLPPFDVKLKGDRIFVSKRTV